MEVTPGYKQTEMGIIPEDWDIKELSTLLDQSRNIRYGIVQPGKYDPKGCLMLRSQDYSKGWTDPNEMHRVNSCLENQYRNARIRSTDLIMTIVGAGIGQVEIGPPWLDGAILSRSTARIAIDETKAVRTFVAAYLKSPAIKRQILECQKEGAQPVISCQDLAKFLILYPPFTEQEEIAEALSDANSLIESLEQLIAKKCNLKQGAMQELLHPKHDWIDCYIGNLLTIKHGKSQSAVVDKNGIYPILASGGQIGTANQFLYNKPSVLIGRKGTIDHPQYMDEPFWSVDTLFYSEIHAPNNAKYLFYQFCLIDWMHYNEASGVPSLNARTIEQIKLKVPKPGVQTSIAIILSDMDAEISGLEAKLAKTRQIKQGMMQELLTGRIRLI